jgi:hypothetical protein
MKRAFVIAVAVLGLACTSRSQTIIRSDTFTFGAYQCLSCTSLAPILTWDGSDPANPPYPDGMGYVSISAAGISGIDVPYFLGRNDDGLGYLNNGYLEPCNPAAWGTPTWTIGDGTNNGDTYTVTAATSCPYFTGEYGTFENSNNRLDSFNVTATYTRKFVRTCSRYICRTHPVDTLQGGSGTITEWDISTGTPTPDMLVGGGTGGGGSH